MQISYQIDQLITSLEELKPLLSQHDDKNSKRFSDLMRQSLDSASDGNPTKMEATVEKNLKKIPDWVNPQYSYDPENPRKPNMRELMEAMSGKSLQQLYEEPSQEWDSITRKASEMLYGVVGSNTDTRDWAKIMAADDVLDAAQLETGKMYDSQIYSDPNLDADGNLLNNVAVLKDKDGNILRRLPNDLTLANEVLTNFGAAPNSIPREFEDEVATTEHNASFSNLLEILENRLEKIKEASLKSTAEMITERLQGEIPISEYNKL